MVGFWYEAVVEESVARDAPDGKSKVKLYFLRYNGWSDHWNEWVPESRVLKDSAENRARQKERVKEFQRAHKRKRQQGVKAQRVRDQGYGVSPEISAATMSREHQHQANVEKANAVRHRYMTGLVQRSEEQQRLMAAVQENIMHCKMEEEESRLNDNQTLLQSVGPGARHAIAVRVAPDAVMRQAPLAPSGGGRPGEADGGWSPSFSLLVGLDGNANCKTTSGRACIFPFTDRTGITHTSCTEGNLCATQTDSDGIVIAAEDCARSQACTKPRTVAWSKTFEPNPGKNIAQIPTAPTACTSPSARAPSVMTWRERTNEGGPLGRASRRVRHPDFVLSRA